MEIRVGSWIWRRFGAYHRQLLRDSHKTRTNPICSGFSEQKIAQTFYPELVMVRLLRELAGRQGFGTIRGVP